MDKGVFHYHEKGFFEPFWDSVWFAHQATFPPQLPLFESPFVCNKFAKASIINAALSLEAAANCCCENLLSGQFNDDVEKFSALSKLDVYLLSRGKPQLDRGSKFVQPMRELVELRNAYVHPKVARREFTVGEDKNFALFSKEPKRANALGFAVSPVAWNHEAAKVVLKTLTSFFDYYFLQCCGHSAEQVRQVLYSDSKGFIVWDTIKEWAPKESKAMQETGTISLKFIGL